MGQSSTQQPMPLWIGQEIQTLSRINQCVRSCACKGKWGVVISLLSSFDLMHLVNL
jgi:hypothetical protein